MADQQEFTPTRFVVVGRTFTTVKGKGKGKGKRVVGTVLQRVNDDGRTLNEEREVYASKELRHKKAGGVYVIEATDTSIRSASARYDGRWHDDEAVLAWELQVNTFELSLIASKRERDDAKLPAALEALRPLLLIYNRTNWQGRLGIELLVLNYLRTSGGKFNDDDND